MASDITHLKDLTEQNRQNIEALAQSLGVEGHLDGDVGNAKWASVFGLPHTKEEQGSDAEQVAELMEQNAANLVALAEAVGVSEHQLSGKATSADFSKVFAFAGAEGE
jgi:hypothetical protein